MKEFKVTYFFDEAHYIRRFIHVESLEKAEKLNTKIKCGVSAHHIEKTEHGYGIHTNIGVLNTTNLLIATGAAEISVPYNITVTAKDEISTLDIRTFILLFKKVSNMSLENAPKKQNTKV